MSNRPVAADSDDLLACESCSADLHPRDDTGYHAGDLLVCPECGATNEVDVCEDHFKYSEPYIARWHCQHGTAGDDDCAECEAEDDAAAQNGVNP